MDQERAPEKDNLNFHCPVAEQVAEDLQQTEESELKCLKHCTFYGNTADLCGRIRKEKADGGVSRDLRYLISERIAPYCKQDPHKKTNGRENKHLIER